MTRFDVPPIWLLGFLILNWLIDRVAPVYVFEGGLAPAAGLLVAGLGIGILVAAALWFRAKKTTIHPTGMPTALIAEGPYRVSRNPIYLGMALVLLGQALWLGSILPMMTVYLFIRLITARFILREEANLHTALGKEAEAYFATTRRWL